MTLFKGKNKWIYEYLLIVLGVLLLAMSTTVFFEPNELVTGGVSGLGIIIQAVSEDFLPFQIPIWLTNLILNIPLFIIGTKVKGFAFLKKQYLRLCFFRLHFILLIFCLKSRILICCCRQFLVERFLEWG